MSGPTQYGNVIEGGNLLIWGDENIDWNTKEQALKASKLPFVPGHVALMPDAHVGIGATVGSVIPTQGAIIPAAIGVDIGCGMIAYETVVTADQLPDSLDDLHGRMARAIPSGVGQGHDVIDRKRKIAYSKLFAYDNQPTALQRSNKMWAKCEKQFGSLGSGNHFFEVCLDERDHVWLVLHSGSRGVGNQLAQVYMKQAKANMKQRFISLEDPDLAYLVEGEDDFKEYIHAMLWAQDYALGNREVMMREALLTFYNWIGMPYPLHELPWINCHHNYTQRESHRGKNLWITRKGAINAAAGNRGVIPGSMGTRSYIVTGLGNAASYNSCSHGAGRTMSRSKAKEMYTIDDLRAQMSDVTSWNEAKAQSLIDEIPSSYKDIDQVMEAQSDLVRVDHTLHQILNLKGT